MSEYVCLLIDAGNSRIKVSSLANPESVIFSCENNRELNVWLSSLSLVEIWYASVRQDSAFDDTKALLKERRVVCHQVKTENEKFGLRNSYTNVNHMGVDRWLAMLATQAKTSLPCATMMFGTAITCDLVVDNSHIGGWIAPGRQLMQQAVTSNTARVFDNRMQAEQLGFGQSTPECVSYGCFAAAQGLITTVQNYLRQHGEEYCLFLTGGDEKVLASIKDDAILRAENLVLQGLARYAKLG